MFFSVLFCLIGLSSPANAASPVSSIEQGFHLVFAALPQITALCASRVRPCQLGDDSKKLLLALQSSLTQELQSPLKFASRKLHPELFFDRPGWPTEVSTAAQVGSPMVIDLDPRSLTLPQIASALIMALAEHQLGTDVGPEAKTSPASALQLASELSVRLSETLVDLPLNLLFQPRVRLLALNFSPFALTVVDDVVSLNLNRIVLEKIECDPAAVELVSLSSISWSKEDWIPKISAQQVAAKAQLSYRCGSEASTLALILHFQFQPTFNGVVLNRPDWQDVRGVQLRLNAALPPTAQIYPATHN